MYFDVFIITIFCAYFIGIYFFYVSVLRLIRLKCQHSCYKAKSIIGEIIYHFFIFFFVLLSILMFLGVLRHAYRVYSSTHVGVYLMAWGEHNSGLVGLIVVSIFIIFFIFLYYTFMGECYDSKSKCWCKVNRGYLFNIPRIKYIYKLLSLVLVTSFILSAIQYYSYLSRIEAYLPVDKYRPYSLSWDTKENIETFLNEKYHGQSFDEIFTATVNDLPASFIERENTTQSNSDGFIYHIRLAIGAALILRPRTGNKQCLIYLKFNQDGTFSHAKERCLERGGWSFHP